MFSWKKILGVLIIFISLLLAQLYYYFGIGHILELFIIIDRSSPQNAAAIIKTFDRMQSSKLVHKALISRLESDAKGPSGIWLLDLKGLVYYKLEVDTKVYKYSICENGKWAKKNVSLRRPSVLPYHQIVKEIMSGDYVEVALLPSNKVKYVNLYDWWVFYSPSPLGFTMQQCLKR